MIAKILIGIASVIGGLVAIAILAYFFMTRGPKELRDRKLDRRATVNLEGLGSASLPPTFTYAGIVNSGTRKWFGGSTTNLDTHLDEERITFRFEQGQHNLIGGHRANPVLLTITLFNDTVPAERIGSITNTPVGEFYSPTGDRRIETVAWLTDASPTGVTTKSGDLDDVYSPGTKRWLVIHVDPARRVRVDFYAWQKVYTLEEAHRLVRGVAASVSSTSALQKHFLEIATFDERAEATRKATIAEAVRELTPCGITEINAGKVSFGADCVAHLNDSGRFLAVARYLGRVPRAAATAADRGKPVFTFAFTDKDFATGSSTGGRPNLDIHMFFWDADSSAWRVDGLQTFLDDADSDGATPAIIAALSARGAARADVFLWDFRYFDAEFHPENVKIAPFLERSARYRDALAAGRIIAGARATPGSFER